MISHVLYSEPVNDVNFWGHNIKKVPNAPDPLLEWYRCTCSPYTCLTIQGYKSHLFKVHNSRQPDRALIDTTVCCACTREFWTRERVITHITKSSRKCLSFYRECMPRLDDEALAALESKALEHTRDLQKSGYRRAFAQMPVVRVLGPRTQVAEEHGISHLYKRAPPQNTWPSSPLEP